MNILLAMIYIIKIGMQRQDRIVQPQTIISIIAFVFSLWWVWATLNGKIKELERKIDDFDSLDLNTKIAQIQTDLEWIKAKLNEK